MFKMLEEKKDREDSRSVWVKMCKPKEEEELERWRWR